MGLLGVRVERIKNTDFYLYNPYLEAFQNYLYTSREEVDYSDDIFFNDFCKREEYRLELQMKNKTFQSKYNIENDMFKNFVLYYKKNGTLY